MYAFNQTVNDNFDPTAPPNQMQMPMSMPMPDKTVPNVMMDFSDAPRQNAAPPGYMETAAGYMDTQSNYNNGPGMGGVQQAVTYEHNAVPFDIEDFTMRRQFFRKVFTILLIQHLLALPVIEIFILCFDEPISPVASYGLAVIAFMVSCVMYIFSDYRRHMPMNMIVLGLTTLYVVVQEGIYATHHNAAVAFTSELVMIGQLFAMIVYSKQTRFKFTNVNAILLTLLIFIFAVAVIAVISPLYLLGMRTSLASFVIYCVYDTQLMLSGHHGYNLKSDEHIFGAVNIYADMPNILWRFIYNIYEFFRKCCFAEVC